MKSSLDKDGLCRYVAGQVNRLFDDGRKISPRALAKYMPGTVDRVVHCFSHIRRKYFFENGSAVFNHLHGDQYSMFLYILCSEIHRRKGPEDAASKIFLLNKALHGIDAYYGIELPSIFMFVHPLGTILGKASYSDYFVIYQNCTVGSNEAGVYPSFEGPALLYAKASIIGDCRIGGDCVLGAGASVIDTHIPEKRVVLGSTPSLTLIPNKRQVLDRSFRR